MLFSEWYNKQCIHTNWQPYTQINRGTICAKELPFRVQPFRGLNCGLIPHLNTCQPLTFTSKFQLTEASIDKQLVSGYGAGNQYLFTVVKNDTKDHVT